MLVPGKLNRLAFTGAHHVRFTSTTNSINQQSNIVDRVKFPDAEFPAIQKEASPLATHQEAYLFSEKLSQSLKERVTRDKVLPLVPKDEQKPCDWSKSQYE